jgi:acyl-CoA dehydrogenase
MSDATITREDLQMLAETAERFAKTEIAPHLEAWEKAGELPRDLHRRAAELGLLGLGYPEALGGTPAPWSLRNVLAATLARHGASGGLMASLFSHNIGLPPIQRHGSAELQAEVIPGVLRGEQISALAITEPGGGTDVSSLRTTAVRDGDEYVVNGEKIFITSGMRADWITAAVRTDPKMKGPMGVSMLVIPGHAAGVSRSRLDKMGWHCSDTAHLRFDNVRVPARYLVGEEGQGFKMIMTNFNGERLSMAAMSLGFSERCYDDALDWARQRKTFGMAIIDHQVIRHKLMDMKMRIESTRAWLDAVTARGDSGDKSAKGAEWVAQVCLLKNHATQTMQFLRRRRGADSRGHGLHAGHGGRAHLPRGQGDDDRWRHRGDHEGAGVAPTESVKHRVPDRRRGQPLRSRPPSCAPWPSARSSVRTGLRSCCA